jgi:3-dehydroquinate synthase II/3-amino-4-hydroxybenzoic acid synthase
MLKRERIQLERVDGDRNRAQESNTRLVWFNTQGISQPDEAEGMLQRVFQSAYAGIVLYPDNLQSLVRAVPARMTRVLHASKPEELELLQGLAPQIREGFVVASDQAQVLAQAAERGLRTCFRTYVDDADSLHRAIQDGKQHAFLMIRFRDPTNIPLELVIASLQATQTVLLKELENPTDVDDALVTLGVMEVGADGIMFSPKAHAVMDDFLARLERLARATVQLSTATIVRTSPMGMGYRSCIDTTTLFSETEGILVGSTSQGGLLCCAEVFFLPYMELRPFRVNAGAVHSYVYNFNDRTDYMSELRAGSQVMLVDRTGAARRAGVGRMKTEVRPLRLIEAEFASGERINTIMQDDWHVRIFSEDAKPLNITELRPGDKVLGHLAKPGRHVGIKVDEHIMET